MGKRELLLVFVFVILGTVLYQATAPPPPEGSRGFSFMEMFRAARSGMGERNARRAETRTAEFEVPANVNTLDLGSFQGRLLITGSGRATAAASLEATLYGVDEADLDQQAETLQLTSDVTDGALVLGTAWRDIGARPDYALTLRIPSALRVRVGGRGTVDVSGTAGIDLVDYRGDVIARRLTGPVKGTHRDGRADFDAGATLDFETSRGTVRANAPASTTLKATMSDIEVMDAAGPVTLDQTRCTIEILRAAGSVLVRGTGGTLKLRDVRAPVEIDAERLTVSTTMATAVPMRIHVRQDDVDVMLPEQGVTLEVSADRGQLRVPTALPVTEDGGLRRAGGPVNGGGPVVSLKVERGTLTVRTP